MAVYNRQKRLLLDCRVCMLGEERGEREREKQGEYVKMKMDKEREANEKKKRKAQFIRKIKIVFGGRSAC